MRVPHCARIVRYVVRATDGFEEEWNLCNGSTQVEGVSCKRLHSSSDYQLDKLAKIIFIVELEKLIFSSVEKARSNTRVYRTNQ